jgi:hypothetical protein
MPIKYITGLIREYHYVKVRKEDGEVWAPAMVITRNRLKGRSFIITLDALWKYDEPINSRNPAVLAADMQDFEALLRTIETHERLAVGVEQALRAQAEHKCAEFAGLINKSHGFLLCTAYNLAVCMSMMEIWPKGGLPQAAAQLLMWIQDGLDQLKNMPEMGPEEARVIGEAQVFEGSTKVGSGDITVSETELMTGDL